MYLAQSRSLTIRRSARAALAVAPFASFAGADPLTGELEYGHPDSIGTHNQQALKKIQDTRMRNWGESPWRGTEVPTHPLQDSSPEVAIIGGGLTGASAAYHLARRGVPNVLLEAERLGDGASGRTGGIALEGTARGILEGTGQCLAALEQLVTDTGIDCDLKLPGCWEIVHRDDSKGAALPWQDGGHGIGILRTVPGGIVDPAALLTGIARAAAKVGAIIHERAEVRHLHAAPQPVLELDRAVIRPRFAIVAANAWINSLLPGVRHVNSALTFACATEPLDRSTMEEIGLGQRIPFYTADMPYLWGRTCRNGQVIFGAGLIFGSPEELARINIGAGEAKAVMARLAMRVHGLHPALKEVRLSHQWAGPIAIPDRYVPLLGRLPGAPAVLLAGGYSGHGVALSVSMGRLLARAILDGDSFPAWAAVSK
jgi:gamma-glutamylputrescine oxidase